MSLSVGARVGHYAVTTKIGEGGMGEVWPATDTKLNHQVALKFLPEAFATDPDRLARFQREAQVLASLNYPNIARIVALFLGLVALSGGSTAVSSVGAVGTALPLEARQAGTQPIAKIIYYESEPRWESRAASPGSDRTPSFVSLLGHPPRSWKESGKQNWA